jgi:uncharacterized protein YjbI with pentapeptide repeats
LIEGTNLSWASLFAIRSGGITGEPTALPPEWSLAYGYLLGPEANLSGANLSGKTLTGYNLSNANLFSANLSGAVLADVDIFNANLLGADLRGIRSSGLLYPPGALPDGWSLVYPPGALPDGWSLASGYLIGPEADLTGATLRGVSLPSANLSGANLTDAILSWADLRWADLSSTSLGGVDLSTVDLRGVISGGIVSGPSSLPPGWHFRAGYLIGPSANLVGADLSGVVMTGFDLTGSDLTGANLTGVRSGSVAGNHSTLLPTGWKLIAGHLVGPGANLGGAELAGADLTGIDLAGTNLIYSNLSGAVLNGCNLSGVQLFGADLAGIRASGITGTPTSLPGSWQLSEGFLLGPGVDLSGLVLEGFVLAGDESNRLNLTGADLRGTVVPSVISFTDLAGADLRGADLTGVWLASTVLSNVRTEGLKAGPVYVSPYFPLLGLPSDWQALVIAQDIGFFGVDEIILIGPGANVDGIDFSEADLAGVASGQLSGAPAALPASWSLVGGYLIGPGAMLVNAALDGFDLRNAALEGADLRGAQLEGANLTDADLTGIDLTGANLLFANLSGAVLNGSNLSGAQLFQADLTGIRASGITGTPASLPDSWQLLWGFLLGPGVDLSGSVFEDSVLVGDESNRLNLTGANLRGTVVPSAIWFTDLAGADLRGADLTGAWLVSTDLSNVLTEGLKAGPVYVSPNFPLLGLPSDWQALVIAQDIGFFGDDEIILIGPGANVDGIDFSEADLAGVASGRLSGAPAALPPSWSLVGGYLIGPGAMLRDAALDGLDLRNRALNGADLRGAGLADTDFSGADLSGADLRETVGLDTTIFTDATLEGMLLPPDYAVVNGQVTGGNRSTPISPFRAWARHHGLPDHVGENHRAVSGQPLLLHHALDLPPDAAIPQSRLPRLHRNPETGITAFQYTVPKADRGVMITPQVADTPSGPWEDVATGAVIIGESESDTHYEFRSSNTPMHSFFRISIEAIAP